MVMVAAEHQHSFARRGLPAVECRTVERDEGAVVVRPDRKIFHAQVGQVIRQAPCDAVHVVLHGCFDRQPQFPESGHGLEERLVIILARQLGHVEEHGRHLDLPCLDVPDEFVHLCLGTYAQPFAYGPRGFACPAELRVVRVVGRQVAVFHGIVDIAQVLGEYFGLRFGIADVRVRVLHQVDGVFVRRGDFHRRRQGFPAVGMHFEIHRAAFVPFGNVDLDGVYAA